MDGHSRAGAFGGDVGQDSDSDPFGRMRNFGSLGRGGDVFSHPGWGGFSHGSTGDSWSMDDPMDGMEGMRPRQRPKFSSASTMMGPRPFQRERRASAGPPEQPADGPGRERIIPIQVERDETDGAAAAPAAAAPQPPQQAASPRQQRPYVRRGTMDTPVSTLQTEDLQRDARARSAPPDPEPKAAAARVPPLNVQAATAAAPAPHKPNYFNSSPKPFSAQQRPFQTPSFGPQGQIPIPVKVEREQTHQHQQHPQQHQQQAPKPQPQPEEPKPQPPPPPPKPKSPKERAMETIEGVRQRVEELGGEVDAFTGHRGEKQHLYLDEMLTRELLKLDNVEANGDDEIRTTRKQAIMSIQKCLAQLEGKVTTPAEAAAKAEAAKREAAMDTAEAVEAGGEAGAEGAAVETAAEGMEMKPAGEGQPQTTETPAAMEAEAQPVTQAADSAAAQTPAAPEVSPVPTPVQDNTHAAAEPAAASPAPAQEQVPAAAPANSPAAAADPTPVPSPAPAAAPVPEDAAAAPAGQTTDQS